MKKILTLAALLSFMAACKKDKNDDKKDGPVLMPLAIGNQWVFDHTEYDQNDVAYNTYMEPPNVVLKQGTRPGFYFIDSSEQVSSTATDIQAYIDNEPAFKFLKSSKIDTFSRVTDVDGYKTVSIAFPDTTKVLTFNSCYRNEYLYYDPNGALYGKDVYYVSPGIGIVRNDYYAWWGNNVWHLDYREDLKSYIIK